ncbi:MAG: acetylxylan esterase [Pirellulaceae bacterium]|nr:MAG: acetylxylan esterase [Pirellulaceae bacterium]
MERPDAIDRRLWLKHVAVGLFTASACGTVPLRAAGPPDDSRLGPLRDLNGYFPFQPPRSLSEWHERARYVRRRVLVACGLWPMPPRPAVEAVVHGRVERDDYTVDKVYFQSAPGLYVTGNLYRPRHAPGKLPVVLCPHGHWANGRFFDHGEQGVAREIAAGAERFPIGGRYPLQARCVQLARMGCLVFHYDMLGYADSVPFTEQVAHRLREQRPEMSQVDRWGIFSAQAELRLINILGLQTFNSIRILDWLLSQPDVDAARVGVTGASGGGTQTFMLAAVDDRPTAVFPAVMVSTAMQGGCTCENACYLRIDTGNIELAALCAPRPLGMTAANDWTREIETKGLPELKQLYRLWGAEDRVEAKYFDFDHNYNYVSRAMMYEFFNKHFQLGLPSPIEEKDFIPLTASEMSVWNEEHPKPPQNEEAELAMLRAWDARWQEQWQQLLPRSPADWPAFRSMLHGAFDIMIGRRFPGADEVKWETDAENVGADVVKTSGRLRYLPASEQLPALILKPNAPAAGVVVWVHPDGKSTLLADSGAPSQVAQSCLHRNLAVLGMDVLYTGDFVDGKPFEQTRRVDNPREIAAYTLGYNHPLFAQRVHDVMTAVAVARQLAGPTGWVWLVGSRGGRCVGGGCRCSSRARRGSTGIVDQRLPFRADHRYSTSASVAGSREIRRPARVAGRVRSGTLDSGRGTRTPGPDSSLLPCQWLARGRDAGCSRFAGRFCLSGIRPRFTDGPPVTCRAS